jgi:hypothetical protein
MTARLLREFAGSFSLGWGTAGWLVLLVLFIVLAQQRRRLSELMLALALMCTTAWLVSPAYSLTLSGIMSNDMLFWAAIMIVLSAGAITLVHRNPRELPSHICSTCGYDLTGNVSGVCPECGTAVQARADLPRLSTLG